MSAEHMKKLEEMIISNTDLNKIRDNMWQCQAIEH